MPLPEKFLQDRDNYWSCCCYVDKAQSIKIPPKKKTDKEAAPKCSRRLRGLKPLYGPIPYLKPPRRRSSSLSDLPVETSLSATEDRASTRPQPVGRDRKHSVIVCSNTGSGVSTPHPCEWDHYTEQPTFGTLDLVGLIMIQMESK